MKLPGLATSVTMCNNTDCMLNGNQLIAKCSLITGYVWYSYSVMQVQKLKLTGPTQSLQHVPAAWTVQHNLLICSLRSPGPLMHSQLRHIPQPWSKNWEWAWDEAKKFSFQKSNARHKIKIKNCARRIFDSDIFANWYYAGCCIQAYLVLH